MKVTEYEYDVQTDELRRLCEPHPTLIITLRERYVTTETHADGSTTTHEGPWLTAWSMEHRPMQGAE